MLETYVTSLGDPGSFTLTDKSDPLYYIARFAHEQSMNLYALESESFKWEQEQAADIAAVQTPLETYVTDFASWLTTAIANSSEGIVPVAPPPLPSLPNLPVSGIIVGIVLKALAHLVVKWLEGKLNPNTEAKEIAQVLRDAFIGETPAEETYPLIEQLANTPLEIILSMKGGYQEAFYSDRIET